MHTYKLGEHDVCLDTDSDTIYLANSVATRIWSLNKEAYSTDDIAEILSNEYDAPKERALADVNTLLSSQLSEHQVKFEKYSDYIPDTEYVPSKLFNTKSHALINLAGFTVSIFCETAGLAEKIQSVFPTFAAHSTNKEIEIFIFERDGKWPITSEGKTLDIGKTENDVVLKCCREIVGKVRELTPNWCTIHGAAVSKNNAGILLPAIGGSGKSTLAAHLISNGFKLLHDDTIILRASDGDMMPTTMPLSIKVGSWSVLQTSFPQLVNLTEFGQGPRRVKLLTPDISQVCTESVKCKVIVSPKWVSKPQDPVLEKISVEEQFAEIIEGGCFFERPICPAYLKKFVTWLDRFPCYKLTYNRLDQALDTINSLV